MSGSHFEKFIKNTFLMAGLQWAFFSVVSGAKWTTKTLQSACLQFCPGRSVNWLDYRMCIMMSFDTTIPNCLERCTLKSDMYLRNISPLVISPWLTPMLFRIAGLSFPFRFTLQWVLSYKLRNVSIIHPPPPSSRFSSFCIKTRQIWGIWKLRPAYSPETPNLGQNRWCFVPCDLEIWWMTLENNRASLLCCFKLCATFHSHWWIQTGVTVRKRPIWVKFDDF